MRIGISMVMLSLSSLPVLAQYEQPQGGYNFLSPELIIAYIVIGAVIYNYNLQMDEIKKEILITISPKFLYSKIP